MELDSIREAVEAYNEQDWQGSIVGHSKHHAILVTAFGPDLITAHEEAIKVFGVDGVTQRIHSTANGYASFMIPPDGGKENGNISRAGNDRRNHYVQFLHSGAVYVDWVEVQYGDEMENDTHVVRHSDEYGYGCDATDCADPDCPDHSKHAPPDRRAAIQATRAKQ